MTTGLNNFNPADEVKALVVYTGNGFDASADNATVSNSVELSDISSTYIGLKNYVVINSTIRFEVGAAAGAGGTSQFKIECKDIGGAYSTDVDFTNALFESVSASSFAMHDTKTLTWLHALTAAEKSNGLKIKLTGTGISSGAGRNCSVTNIQTSVYAIK